MLMRDAKDVAGVEECDQQITPAERDVFSQEDARYGSVWDGTTLAALALSTPEVAAAAAEWFNGMTKFPKIDQIMSAAAE